MAMLFRSFAVQITLAPKMTPDWNALNAIGAIASALVAAIGLTLVYVQLRAGRRIAEADLILRLEAEWIDHFSPTYKKFLAGGVWSIDGTDQLDNDGSVEIEEYLDFFATLSTLIDHGLISLKLVDEMFAYRFFVATNNYHTKKIITANRDYWPSLLRLYDKWLRYRKEHHATVPNGEHSLVG